MKRVSPRCADSFALETLEPRSMMAADLTGVGITLLNVPQLGPVSAPQPVVFGVLNMGDRRAPVGTRVRFYASRDTVLHSGDRAIRDSVLPDPIRPGERVSYTKVIKLPRGMDDGLYRIIMQIDPDNRIVENDETNNDVSSAAGSFRLPGNIEGIEINKRYLRPGSAATVTALNVTNFEPSSGVVKFFAQTPRGDQTLLGIGTRDGRNYVLTFVADRVWMTDTVTLFAVAIKHSLASNFSVGSVAQMSIQSRNAGATIGLPSYSPTVTRGQSTTINVAGVSSEATSVALYFDSNFDGQPQIPIGFTSPYANMDSFLAGTVPSSGTASISFVVPDWFPSAPARAFVVVFRRIGMFDFSTRAYPILLSAH